MFNFIVRRILVAIPTMLAIIILSFVLMHSVPGSPFVGDRGIDPQVLANLNAKYGLNQPFYVQLYTYISNVVLHFDFGPSFVYKDQTVNSMIAQGFPITLSYGGLAFVISVFFGISLGIAAAIYHNSWLDYTAVGFSIGASVLPTFISAPLLVLIFTLWLHWLPGGGWDFDNPLTFILPVAALSTGAIASIARITRSSMLEVLNSNHIRTARAKGLPMRRVIFPHAFKPALLPIVSYLGPAFVGMITGSVIIDTFFSTGGMGVFFVNAATNRDYSLMLGITILVGGLTILFNLLVDVLYAWIDPKIRY